jgi:hypothetical protein
MRECKQCGILNGVDTWSELDVERIVEPQRICALDRQWLGTQPCEISRAMVSEASAT